VVPGVSDDMNGKEGRGGDQIVDHVDLQEDAGRTILGGAGRWGCQRKKKLGGKGGGNGLG